MQIFRNHFINWAISLLLILGLAANVSLPYSSDAQKTAFTQWLDRNVIDNGGEGESAIRSHIRDLPNKHDSFPLLLEQATLIVVNHINDFNLPLENKNTDTGLIGIWLFEQWSQYKDESGSMNALIPEVIKPGLKWLIHNNTFNTAIFATEASFPKVDFTDSLDKILYIIQSLPIPFLSGISINAP